jgi:imidazole glycerol-phosphate synthase subunit HisF
MTPAEHVLWRELRGKSMGIRFRRQEPVSGYIVDFYAPSIQLAVEIDGPVHNELDDMNRDLKLARINVQVMRFTNDAVINDLNRVVASIWENVVARTASMPFRVSVVKPADVDAPEAATGPPATGGSRGAAESN